MIYLLIISALLFGIGIWLLLTCENFSGLSTLGFLLSLIGGIATVAISLVWIISISSYKSNINQYYAIKQTINDARSENISEVERAALTTKIIEVNEYLASAKYWNGTIFGDNVLDEFAELEYLK